MNTLKTLGFKRHLMTAISFFLPVICAAGFLLAIGNIMGGESIDDFSQTFSFADTMSTMGGYGLGFLPMIVSTAIAYSIADKPGIAPGLIVGFVAHGINTGFIGGLLQVLLLGLSPSSFMRILKFRNGWRGCYLLSLFLSFPHFLGEWSCTIFLAHQSIIWSKY